MKEFLSGLTLGTIIALTTLLIVSVAIAQPNPGHSADQIGPGTFYGGGDYIFPSSSNIVMSDSGIYLRTDKFHGIKWSYNMNGFDGPTIFGYAGVSIEKRNTTGNYSIANFTFNEVNISTNLRLPYFKKLYLGDAYIYGAKAFDINYFYTPDMFFIGKTLGVNGSTFYVDSNTGRVGVGTQTPSTKLDVRGRGWVAYFGDTNRRAGIWSGGTGSGGDPYRAIFGTPDNNAQLRFNIGGNDYMTITTSGNVGIGTTSPGGRLDLGQVSDRPVIKWKASGGREYGIEPYDNRFILADLGVRRILEADPAGWTTLWGNVGIGTTSPGGKLAVRQDDDGTPFLIRLQNLKSGNEADFTLKAGGGKFIIGDEIKTAERFIIDENGGVIIKSGILLGGTGSLIANFLDLGDVDHEPRYIFCMQKVGPIDWVNYQPCGGNKEWWIANIYGYLLAPTSGTYYFYVTVDDGFALFIDGALCKASWKEQGATEYSCSKYLTKGWHPIFLQHLQTKTDERLKLEWKKPGGSRELIPSTYMAFPPIWGLGFTGAVKH